MQEWQKTRLKRLRIQRKKAVCPYRSTGGGSCLNGATTKTIKLNELVKALEEKFGVSAAAPVAVAAAPAAGAAAAAPAAEEKTEFNVVLKDVGAKKIDVIKVVRAFTGLGLVEAKAAVEKGGVLKENVAKEEAEKIVADLKAAGATAAME